MTTSRFSRFRDSPKDLHHSKANNDPIRKTHRKKKYKRWVERKYSLSNSAALTEIKNCYNLAYIVEDQLNVFSDGSCIDEFACVAYDNGRGVVTGLMRGNSTEAEVVSGSQCLITLDNPDKKPLYHHTDSAAVQSRNFTAAEEVVNMFAAALNKEPLVNFLHRMGHPDDVTEEVPEYVHRFGLMDTTARSQLIEFLKGSTRTILVPETKYVRTKANISNCVMIDRLQAHYDGRIINVVTIMREQILHSVLFVGENVPEDLFEAKHVNGCSTYTHMFIGTDLEKDSWIHIIRGFSRHYMHNFFTYQPVIIDPTGHSRCKIEILNN
jgi:limonene-1,2-epoxide hydrolase